MNKLKLILAGLMIVPTMALAVSPAAVSAQEDLTLETGLNSTKTEGHKDVDAGSAVKRFINIMLWIIGVLSVVFLIWGGIRYVTSAGDSNKVTAAKNTIVYAIVGLIIAILSYAMVNFVIKSL